jgi:hypothetical protein
MAAKNIPQFSTLGELTAPAVRRRSAVSFAGFLVREDEDSVYIADPQGTWAVPRGDIAFVEDWDARCVPDGMQGAGRPVTLGVRDGATIFEIRPWTMSRTPGGMGPEARKVVDRVFSLGGAPLPIGPSGIAGEEHMAELERNFSRRLGWNPSDPCTSPVAHGDTVSHVSKTIVVNDGYTDVDDGF